MTLGTRFGWKSNDNALLIEFSDFMAVASFLFRWTMRG
jgi:hypothetical protein